MGPRPTGNCGLTVAPSVLLRRCCRLLSSCSQQALSHNLSFLAASFVVLLSGLSLVVRPDRKPYCC